MKCLHEIKEVNSQAENYHRKKKKIFHLDLNTCISILINTHTNTVYIYIYIYI